MLHAPPRSIAILNIGLSIPEPDIGRISKGVVHESSVSEKQVF